MECGYFDAGECRSCSLMGVPIAIQRRDKDAEVRALLATHDVADDVWEPIVGGDESHYRTKAKMVVGGKIEAPSLGILDSMGAGVDLRDCGICSPGILAALPAIADALVSARVPPYRVPDRRGEAKVVIVTESPAGELMVRFVLRSSEAIARLRKQVPAMRAAIPGLRVVTANIQPVHAAVLEGEHEVVLTEAAALPIDVNGLTLRLGPRAFVQTNSQIAAALYAQAARWAADSPFDAPNAGTVDAWDLYCGVGGFALHLAAAGRSVLGVELSPDAIDAAREAAALAGLPHAAFLAGDAATIARDSGPVPPLVVVNPPRRGLGVEFAGWIEQANPLTVLYSSCNPTTLARDLESMPSYRVARARAFDMFPQTPHLEVLVELRRR